jgi:hypothetical protein
MFKSEYLACAFDPAYFMEWAFDLTPEPWQEKFLKSGEDERVLFLCTRQGGKSTVTAASTLYEAVFFSNRLILIVAPRFRQAQETFNKVRVGYRRARKFCGFKKKTTTELHLNNDSRIVALPGEGDNIRGFSGAYKIIIDEASRVHDDLYKSIKPMIASSKGSVLLLSTPFGQRGFFYQSYKDFETWKRYTVTAERFGSYGVEFNPDTTFECKRITKEFIQETVREIGDLWVRQEFYCEFTASELQVFSHELLMKATVKGTPMRVPYAFGGV